MISPKTTVSRIMWQEKSRVQNNTETSSNGRTVLVFGNFRTLVTPGKLISEE